MKDILARSNARRFWGVFALAALIITILSAPVLGATIVNGDFGNGITGWTHDSSTVVIGLGGANSLVAADIGAFDTPNSYLGQVVSVAGSSQYKLSFIIGVAANNAVGLTAVGSVTVTNLSGAVIGSLVFSNVSIGALNGTNGFVSFSTTFTTPTAVSGATSVGITFNDLTPNGGRGIDLLVDNVVLTLAPVGSIIQNPSAASLVYNNSGTFSGDYLPSTTEFGDEIILAPGGNNLATKFEMEYYGSLTPAAAKTGQIRFYANDGANGAPGTVLFTSSPFALAAGYQSVILSDFLLPLPGNSDLTWTVQFSGLATGEKAGLNIYETPSLGTSPNDFWQRGTNGVWVLNQLTGGSPKANFGAQLYGVQGSIVGQPSGNSVAYTSSASGSVTLDAVPAPGFLFSGWSGAASGLNNPLTVSLTSGQIVTANYFPNTLPIAVTGTGSVTKAPDQLSYALGDSVVLTATPGRYYTFLTWSDQVTANPRTVTFGTVSNLTAVFTNTVPLELMPDGSQAPVGTPQVFANTHLGNPSLAKFSNGGTFTVGGMADITIQSSFTSARIFYTLDGSQPSFNSTLYTAKFAVSQSATLRAIAYSSDLTQSQVADPVTIVIVPTYTLTATSPGGGSVTFNPTNDQPYLSGTVVTLTATPAPGWTFMNWAGDGSGTSPTLSVTMNSAKTVQAIFGTAITNTITGQGSLTFSPAQGPYPFGSTVVVTPVPQSGYYFGLWGGAASGTAFPLNFVVTSATPGIAALFAALGTNQYILTTHISGGGTITNSPAKNAYTSGDVVTLTATPSPGNRFVGWTGDLSGSTDPATLTMNGTKDVTATFVPNILPTVSLTAPADGAVFTAQESVTLSATAADSDGAVSVVRFYQGTTFLGQTASGPYSLIWTNPPPGSYALTAVAIDNSGGATTSSAANIVVGPSNTVIVAIGNRLGDSGTQVVVPITSRGFNTIGTFQFSLHWDPAVASFADTEQYGVPGLTSANFGSDAASTGTLNVSWDDTTLAGQSRPDGSVLFAVRFNLTGANGTSSAVTIDGTPTAIEIAKPQSAPLPVLTTAGSVQAQAQSTVTLAGKVSYYDLQKTIGGVTVTLAGDADQSFQTGSAGTYSLSAQRGSYTVTPSKPDDNPASQGVTTLDISLIRRQILALATTLDSPYKLLAADVRGAGSVSTLDISFIRRLILGITNSLPLGLWRFVPADYAFADPLNPWNAPGFRSYTNNNAGQSGQDFIAIKLGDVNASWSAQSGDAQFAPASFGSSGGARGAQAAAPLAPGGTPRVSFQAAPQAAGPSGTVKVAVLVNGFTQVSTAQFSLAWDPQALELVATGDYGLAGLGGDNFGTTHLGALSFSWDDPSGGVSTLPDGSALFAVTFAAKGAAATASTVAFADAPTAREVTVNLQPGAFASQNATVTVALPPRITQTRLAPDGGRLEITIAGGAGETYAVQSSTDLTHWTDLQTVANSNGAVTVDVPPSGDQARFYRVRRQ